MFEPVSHQAAPLGILIIRDRALNFQTPEISSLRTPLLISVHKNEGKEEAEVEKKAPLPAEV